MKFILTLLMSFQLMTSALAAELGQAAEFNSNHHLTSYMAKAQAKNFEQKIREGLELWNKQTLGDAAGIEKLKVSEKDKKALLALLKKSQSIKPQFVETKSGLWEMQSSGHKVSFTMTELYQSTIRIDGKVFSFKDVPFSQIEEKLNAFDLTPKTSWVDILLQNTIGIGDAQAFIPILIIAAVVGVILLGIIYKLKWAPESAVEKMKEIQVDLEKDAATCTESKTSEVNYRDTFKIASDMSERTTLNSATSSSDALRLSLKEQLGSGSRNDSDCYHLMHEAGKKIDVDIPMPTESSIKRMEVEGGSNRFVKETDVKGAVYNLCKAYNALGSCMDTFVGAHVDSSDIGNFKDNATPNHSRFKRATGAGRQ